MKLALLVVVLLTVTGCANVSDVVSTGPGTYMVAAEGVLGNSSPGKQMFKAHSQADAFCRGQGKQVDTINTQEAPGGYGKVASAEVYFRCIPLK